MTKTSTDAPRGTSSTPSAPFVVVKSFWPTVMPICNGPSLGVDVSDTAVESDATVESENAVESGDDEEEHAPTAMRKVVEASTCVILRIWKV